MPQPLKLEKATLKEMWPGSDNKLKPQNKDGGAPKVVTVQFNPQTMKVNFSNQAAETKQPGNSPMQFIGKSTTKLTMELWFDVSLPQPEGGPGPVNDVRQLTKEVAYFLTPQKAKVGTRSGLAPPGVRFQWGTFLFEGVLDTMDETLEFFSNDGRPLRAQVGLAFSKQEIEFQFGEAAAGASAPSTGSQPLAAAKSGDSLQQMAAKSGNPGDWKSIASANGIENPRLMTPGALVNMSAGVGIGVSGGVAASVSTNVQPGVSASIAGKVSFR
jgi:hypothetical protein